MSQRIYPLLSANRAVGVVLGYVTPLVFRSSYHSRAYFAATNPEFPPSQRKDRLF
jgi:hypothetical protein